MTAPRYFAIFGVMRTGSNLLERTLDRHEKLVALGELYNPAFIGGPGEETAFGATIEDRNRDPVGFLEKVIAAHPGQIPGFRIFMGHDRRMLDHAARDPVCARIVLTRDPVDSFLSLKIAQQTQQWMVRKAENRRLAKVEFNADEFADYEARLLAHYDGVRQTMRAAGAPWFEVAYDDLSDLATLNGAARYAGADDAMEAVEPRILRQNPPRAEDKVTNPEALAEYLSTRSAATPARKASPQFTALRSMLVARGVEAICAPIPGVADAALRDFLMRAQALSGGDDKLVEGLKGKQIERRRGRGSFVFSLIRHPADRIRDVYMRFVFGGEAPEGLERLRATLIADYGAPADMTAETGFDAFLDFVGDAIAGRIAAPYHPAFAPQSDLLAAYAAETAVDFVARAETIAEDAAWIAGKLGHGDRGEALVSALEAALIPPETPAMTPERETRVREIFAKDYGRLGYKPLN